MEEEIIFRYSKGAHIDIIAKELGINIAQIMEALAVFKLNNTRSGSFSDELKKVIAERDLNGVQRSMISKELMISQTTIRKCCKEFGDASKMKKDTSNAYLKIKGDFSQDICPECSSRHVNEVNELTIYCMNCGGEFVFNDLGESHIFKILWMNID